MKKPSRETLAEVAEYLEYLANSLARCLVMNPDPSAYEREHADDFADAASTIRMQMTSLVEDGAQVTTFGGNITEQVPVRPGHPHADVEDMLKGMTYNQRGLVGAVAEAVTRVDAVLRSDDAERNPERAATDLAICLEQSAMVEQALHAIEKDSGASRQRRHNVSRLLWEKAASRVSAKAEAEPAAPSVSGVVHEGSAYLEAAEAALEDVEAATPNQGESDDRKDE